MKKHFLLPFLCFLLLQLSSLAQAPSSLELTHRKTTSLIFPFPVKSVDRGSEDILAQVPPGVENILQVKAARTGMGETNLTVITADGYLYSFDVRYAANPTVTRLVLDPPPATVPSVHFVGRPFHETQLKNMASQLAEDERFYYGIQDKAGGAKATLEGIYIHGNTLFLRLVLSNYSSIPYEMDFVRFSVRDRKTARRTASQETEIFPIYSYGSDDPMLRAGHRKAIVFAVDKFSIARDKALWVELFEQQGSRHLQLRIKGRHLLQACPLTLLP